MNYSGYIGAGRIRPEPGPDTGGGRADVLLQAARVILPRKRTIITAGLLTAALAGLVQTLSGPTYTATAIIQPELRGMPAPDKAAGMTPLDPSVLLVGQVQLIRSQPLSSVPIAEHLFGGRSGTVGRPGVAGRMLGWLFGRTPRSAGDVAQAELKRGLVVAYIPRSYLIQVSYTAPTREGAAVVANAVSGEYIRAERRKRLSDRVGAAESTLSSLTLTYGDRHPQIARAKADLEAAQAQLSGDVDAVAPMSESELAGTGLVVPARASLALVDSGLRTVLSGLVFGLLLGLGWVVFAERERLRRILLT